MASSPDAGSTASTDSTAPRPPTPPREACREPAAAPLSKLVPVPARPDPLDSCPSPLQTPPTANTPTSVPPDSSIKSHRKKVEWSAHTEVKEYFDIRKLERLAKSSPASALSPRPIKGILKQSQSHNLGPPSSGVNTDGSAGQVSIIDMLGSTIKQLAGSDHHSKIDAYMMLSRALKASNNLPDRVALQSQMGLFMHFIQRDVSYKNPSGGGIDFSLTNHALTLLATFLYFPAVASTLTNDFGVWMLDYAIQAFENATASKDTLRHLMQIAATQTFSSKVMTSARVGRLVRALHKIESHVTGKSIVLSRLRIYKRLLKQSRGLMALYSDWLDNVFVDMLSGYQDIRDHAIALATEAGFALRSEMAVIRKVNEIFQAVHQDRTYIDFFVKRLNEMLGEKQTSAAVPQVWAAVILYLPYPLDRWPHYSPWLKVVQSAFNTDDGPTKQEANHAWNRHIYLTLHDVGKMSPKALSTLCLPLLTQIRKKANPKTQKAALRLRATVVGGICTVFYYLLAPDNDQHSHDFAWDTAVQPVIAELISLDGKPEIPPGCLMQAACLLLGLLDVTTPRAWGQDRIQKLPPVAPDELPSLDAKWIRRKCDKVMQAVRPIIEHKILELAKRDSVVFRMWQALVGSVAAASARDIKVSEDTVKFFACTFGLLSKVWTAGIVEGDGSSSAPFLQSVGNFIVVLRDALGLLPFTEKRLFMSAPNAFEPLTSPHTPDRTNKPNAIDRPILHHLFLILSSVPPGVSSDDSQLTDLLLSMMEPFLNGKTLVARLELISELLSIRPCNPSSSNGPWVLAARDFELLIESYHDGGVSNPTDSGRVLGPQYREIVTLLERGLAGYPNLPSEQWFSLFDRLSEHLVTKFGEAGRCIILIEPLAKALVELVDTQNEEMSATVLQAIRALFDLARFPRDRASLEIARHRLWGTPMNTARGSAFDPFEHLYKLGNHILEIFYKEFRRFDPDQEVSPIIEAIKDFIVRCFPSSRARTLARLQPGLCLWIQDSRSLLGHSLVSKTVFLAWHDVSSELASRKPLDRSDFDSVEPLLAAAFRSRHPEIVRSAAETWSLLVQDGDHPDCSDNLKSMASDAVSKADNASEQSTGGFGAQASSLRSQQGSTNLVLLSCASSSPQNVQAPLSPSASDSVSAPKRSKRKRRSEATPSDGSRAKSTKKAATPRSRHELAQAAIAPISPSPRVHDESQSLTGRQRGTGEKRRDKAKQCPGQAEDPPPRPMESSHQTNQAAAPQLGGGTPVPLSAYKSATAATPTPRRGQSLQVDDGDPASSPLKPRAYPLLSELASRSKENTILDSENWTFSSPLAAPPTGNQQGPNTTKPSVVPSTSTPTSGKARKEGRSQPPSAAKIRSQAALNPSSAAAFPQEDRQDTEMTDADAASKEKQKSPRLQASKGDPQTPRRSRAGILPSGEESPKSVDEEEFVDATTSFDGCPAPAGQAENGADSVDTSFSLSDLDDNCMSKLTAELQSHNGRDGSPQRVEGSGTRGQQDRPDASRPVSRAEEEPLPPRRSQKSAKTSKRPASPSLPPLAPETKTTEAAAKNRPGQKRKRSEPAQHSNPGKRRRADIEEIPETPGMQAKDPQPGASPERNLRRSSRRPPPPSVSNVQTRGSTRRRPHQDQAEDHHAAAKTAIEAPRTRAAKQNQAQQKQKEEQHEGQHEGQQDDKADTDDEVMSQLMSESIASSHDSSHIEQELGEETRRNHKEAEKPPATRGRETGSKRKTSAAPADHGDGEPSPGREGGNHPQSILQGLQSALAALRKSALSRDEFNKIEDVTMDIKRELLAAETRGREG